MRIEITRRDTDNGSQEITLESLNLSARAYGALYRHGLRAPIDILRLTLEQLAEIPGMGAKTAAEVYRAVREADGKSGDDHESEETSVYRAAIDRYGANAQILMVFEEMSELQKELCKNARGKQNVDEIAEEIADVEIMLAQLKIIYNCGDLVAAYQKMKLDRLAQRLGA